MKRAGLTFSSMTLAAALAACGSDSKAGGTTTPVAQPEPAPMPAEPVAEAPAPAPAPAPEPPAPTYLHGKWVWFELNTGDVEKARAFYGPLLGWTIEDKEMGGQKYSAVSANGKEIGLVQALPADAKAKKMKSGWMGYLSVPDVDAAVAAATAAGATVVLPSMDVPEIGRFAVMTDPAGTPFGVVKAARGDDPDQEPAVGDIVWMEHSAKDAKKVAAAVTFYSAVGGFEAAPMKLGKIDYTMGKAAGKERMGFAKASKAAAAGMFVPYVLVANVDETVKAATKAKGKALQKPFDVPGHGRFAVLADPTGAVFGVMTMAAPTDAATPAADAPATPAPATPAPQQ